MFYLFIYLFPFIFFSFIVVSKNHESGCHISNFDWQLKTELRGEGGAKASMLLPIFLAGLELC
jgi:hypothetical protein